MKDFDITIETKVRVMPREVPGSITETWKWEALEKAADLTFKEIARSMKGYLEDQVKANMRFREATDESHLVRPCCYYHKCICEEKFNFCPTCGVKQS